LAVIIIAGRLEDPAAKVSAMGIGISWLGIFSGVIWGLNMGFQTIAFRCIGLGEFGMLKRYLVRQHKIVAVFALVFLGVVALLYWVAGWQYENKPQVLELFRNF
jgi:Na+-driven multidrug efflux pump